jgi:hypothetical protein
MIDPCAGQGMQNLSSLKYPGSLLHGHTNIVSATTTLCPNSKSRKEAQQMD